MEEKRITVEFKFRINKDLFDEFVEKCEGQKTSPENVIINHMKKQIKNYEKPISSDKNYDNYSYSEFRLEVLYDVYKNYKIVLKENNTRSTADILRFMRTYVA